MVEVLFGESEAASMKASKKAYMTGEKEKVICLGFMLDIGNIEKEVDSSYRKKLIYSMYDQEQWGKNPETDAELREVGNLYVKEWFRLKEYLESGESIRIWYSDASYSRCGFYWLCNWLKNYKNDVFVVRLPECKVIEDSVVLYQNWNEIPPEEFAELVQYEKKLSEEEKRMYALLWAELVEDNSPLRAVINGRLVGVPEDFYDVFIWKKISKKPVKQARLIGDILGYYPVSVGDWWYAKRINHFISEGKIKVIEDSENKYARTICLV